MIRYNKIEQGTLDWFELRWGRIGGTASKGLFVKSDTLLIDILSQRLEEFEPEDGFTSDAMERGKELEPFAREYLNSYTGLEFKETGWLQSLKNELLGISPDGITDCEINAIETKCFGRKEHTRVLLLNDIPKDNIHQVLQYFTVNPKLENLYWLAFRPESVRHFIKHITLDSEIDLGITKKIEVEVIGKRGVPIKPKIVTVPDVKTVREWVKLAHELADELLLEIKTEEEQLNF